MKEDVEVVLDGVRNTIATAVSKGNDQLNGSYELVLAKPSTTPPGFTFLTSFRFANECVAAGCGTDPTAAKPMVKVGQHHSTGQATSKYL